MRKVKPLNDFIFKKVFGEKGNEDILISFINAVLKRTKKDPIIEVEIIDNKQLTKEVILDKTRIIDVRAKLQREKLKMKEYEQIVLLFCMRYSINLQIAN